MKTEILLGDEAVALGALHAGLGGSFAYPGTPATELNEYVFRMSRKFPEVYVEWSTNEKTAYEAALGMSYHGKRAIVSMKHVGLNVAADAFVNSAITGVNGGLVVVVADDPGMHSSQNEQDTRFYVEFSRIPAFEPSNQQEAYDMTLEAFRLSEEIKLPVLIRLVTRLAHSRANVQVGEPAPTVKRDQATDWKEWTLLPSIARNKYKKLIEMQPRLLEYSNGSGFQAMSEGDGAKTGVIASGIGYNYFMENADYRTLPHLKIGVYPLPETLLREFTAGLNEVLILEDGYPFIETRLQTILVNPELKVRGKLSGDLPETGELNPDLVRKALGGEVKEPAFAPAADVILNRPPQLCDGCAHREVYNLLDELREEMKQEMTVFSDIGCYTLGALRTPPSIDTCVCMGASVGMAKGAANSGLKYSVGVIGDSTFLHGGIPTLVKAAGDNTPATFVILDNSTTGMTGQQDVPIPGTRIDTFIGGLGVSKEHIHVIDPRRAQHAENLEMMRSELEYRGTSVIIARRDCIQVIKQKKKRS